jgi:DNA-binding transcriptional LysR family regulator
VTPAEFLELRAFLAVAEERSFRKAAERLGMSPSALSRVVRTLEERVGVRLLNRTTRSVAPTEAGQTLHARVQPLVAGLDDALGEVGSFQDSPKGLVRVNLPRVAAVVALMPKIGAFLKTFPDIRLDLVVDDDMTDVVAQGFDAGIRIGGQVNRDMIAVRLTPDFRMAVVGSADYFAGHPPPKEPRELAGHRCLTYKWAGSGVLFAWRFEGAEGRVIADANSVITVNDTDLLLSAALNGAGLALLAETHVAPHVAKGDLVRVLEDWCGPVPGFYLYYPSRTRMPVALRAFINFIRLPPA